MIVINFSRDKNETKAHLEEFISRRMLLACICKKYLEFGTVFVVVVEFESIYILQRCSEAEGENE